MQHFKTILHTRNKFVIQIGTNLLTDKVKGINLDRMNEIARSVARLNAFESINICIGRPMVSSVVQSAASLPIGS
jgi:glutamate 5-kinase